MEKRLVCMIVDLLLLPLVKVMLMFKVVMGNRNDQNDRRKNQNTSNENLNEKRSDLLSSSHRGLQKEVEAEEVGEVVLEMIQISPLLMSLSKKVDEKRIN